MTDPTRIKSSLAKLDRIRIGIRPWQILLLISGFGIAALAFVSFSLRTQTEEAATYVSQMVATHQIQQGVTDLLLNLEGVPTRRGLRKSKPILNRVNRIAGSLLEGGQVGQGEVVALQNLAHQDSMRILKSTIDDFIRLCGPYLDSTGSPVDHDSAGAALHASFEKVIRQARALHGELRTEIRALDVRFKRLQWTMIILSGALFLTLAILLSARVRQRIGLATRVRRTLERYDALFEKSPLGYQSLDENGKLISVNTAWLETLGYSREEVLGTWMGDYIQPQAIEHFKERFPQFKAAGIIRGVEMPMVRNDGTPIVVAFDGKIESDDQGRFVQTHCVMRDITERVASKKALQARERQQAVVAELGQEALACEDLGEFFDKAVRAVSDTLDAELCKVLEILPDGRDALLRAGVGWKPGLVGEAKIPLGENSQAGYTLLSEGPVLVEDLRQETRFLGPDLLSNHSVISGISVLIGTRSAPLGILGAHSREYLKFNPDDLNFLQSVASLLANTMSRMKKEEFVKKSESELRSLFDHVPVSIGKQDMSGLFRYFDELHQVGVQDFREHFLHNPESKSKAASLVEVLEVNQAYLDLHEVHSKETLLQSLDKLLTPRAHELYVEELVSLAQGSKAFTHKSEISTPDGKVKDVIVKLIVDPEHSDGSLVYVAYVDVTELQQAEEALGHSKALLGALFDTAEDCIFLKNHAGCYTLVNKAMTKLFQRPLDEIIGKDDAELFGEGPASKIQETDIRVLAGETVYSMDPEPIRDETHRFNVVKVPIRNTKGEVTGIFGIARDVTETMQAAEALARSEARIRALVNAADDIIFMKNMTRKYTVANPAFARRMELPMEEILGKTLSELIPEENHEEVERLEDRVFAGEILRTNHEYMIAGKWVCYSVVRVPVRNELGEVEGLCGVSRDITEAVAATQALSESEARFRTLIETAEDIVFMKDKDQRFTLVNPSVEKSLGYAPQEMIGKTSREMFGDEAGDKTEEVENRVLAGESVHTESERYSRSGSLRYCSIIRVPTYDTNGEITGLFGISRDVTNAVVSAKALSASEERFRSLIETANDIIFMKDKDRRFTIVNHACEKHLNKPASEILSKTLAELRNAPSGDPSLEEVSKYVDDIDKRVLAGETVRKLEKNVSERGHSYIDVVKSPMRDTEGNITGICGIARDITEKVEAAEALAKSESQLRTLVETAQDIIFIKDLDRRYTMVNPAMCKLEGKTPEDILGKTNMEAFGREADEYLDSIDMRILAGETLVQEYESEAQGEKRAFNVMRAPMRNSDGEINGLVGIARDVTEYHEVREEILRLATAIEQAGDVVLVTDRDGKIHYVNPAFEKTTGYSRLEALGAKPSILKSGSHDDGFYKNLWDTIQAGKTWEGRFVNKRKDGSLYQENATISAVLDRDGEIVNFVAVKHDITRQIELEEQIRHAHRMEAVGHLAGGLAHDFNNILQSMTGFLGFAQDGLDPEDPRSKDLSEVRKGAERASMLTRELLTFSRMREVNLEPMDLRSIILESLTQLRPMLGEDIYLEFKPSDEPMVAVVDKTLMDRAITNLCINACEAMPRGGDLTIEIEHMKVDKEFAAAHAELSEGAHVCFCITDSGGGVSEDRLGQLFDPFYSTKDVGEGTGLGLAVVHGIVKQHGGMIEVESELGRGTRFRVILPEADAGVVSTDSLGDPQGQKPPMAKG